MALLVSLAADIAEINSNFTSERSRLPLIFIATPLDKSSSQWTKDHPSPPVVGRLLLLAKESLSTFTHQLGRMSTCHLQEAVDFQVCNSGTVVEQCD